MLSAIACSRLAGCSASWLVTDSGGEADLMEGVCDVDGMAWTVTGAVRLEDGVVTAREGMVDEEDDAVDVTSIGDEKYVLVNHVLSH